jgi:matrixin
MSHRRRARETAESGHRACRVSVCWRQMTGSARREIAALAACAIVFGHSAPAFAYLKFGLQVGGRTVVVKWTQSPVRYFIANSSAPGVAAPDLQAAAGRAFATWQAAPTSSIAYQFVGFTAASPLEEDGQSTLGFASRPDLDRVLASTDILMDQTTGEIVESDIFFNSAQPWSVAPGGEAGKYDLESVALHEIGHLSGLAHSALGETELRSDGGRRVIAAETVMFPIAYPPGNISARSLRADDIAGISELYPDGGFADSTGSISGRVSLNGSGVYGAHIAAFDPANGTLVAGFSLDSNGRFSIGGLSPGPHVIRVEPLDDADIASFFDDDGRVSLDFRVAFSNRLVVVPRGGDSGTVEIAVVKK